MTTPDYFGVDTALQAFYTALEKADLAAMQALWVSSSRAAVCIHPGGPALVGTQAILESWQAIFSSGPGLAVRFDTLNRHMRAQEVICLVRERLYPLGETYSPDGGHEVLATNVLTLTAAGEWRFLVHHAPAAPAVAVTNSTALH